MSDLPAAQPYLARDAEVLSIVKAVDPRVVDQACNWSAISHRRRAVS